MTTITPTGLDQLVSSGTSVTVKRKDGKSAEGRVVLFADRYKVATGRPGRPLLFRADEVDEITTA